MITIRVLIIPGIECAKDDNMSLTLLLWDINLRGLKALNILSTFKGFNELPAATISIILDTTTAKSMIFHGSLRYELASKEKPYAIDLMSISRTKMQVKT